jgi:hypothetical protein
MTSFEKDGFLGDEISGWEGDFEKRYASKLQLSIEANRLAHRLIFSIQITSSELKDLLLSALLARQVSTFQAFILLARKGLIDQSEMLIRALAESMFLVGAIRKEEGFAEKWVLSDEISRKRSLVRLNVDGVVSRLTRQLLRSSLSSRSKYEIRVLRSSVLSE